MKTLETLEAIFENPDWEEDQYFFIRITKGRRDEIDYFDAELLLSASEEGDTHLIATGARPSIDEALESLNHELEKKIVDNAAQLFLKEAIEEEEDEK